MLPAGQLDKRPKKHHIMTESWSRLSGKMSDWVFFLSLAAAGWSRGWEGKTQLTAASLTRLARLASTPLATCDWVCACVCVFSFWNAKHTHTHTHKHTQSVINQFAQINRCGSYLMSGSDVNPPVVVGRSVSEWFHGFFFLRVLAERGSRSAPLRSVQRES